MSIRFLSCVVTDRQLPYVTTDPAEIDHIALLTAAKLVRGTVPDFGYPGASARIEGMTPDGRAVLALLKAQEARKRLSGP
jgi:hypothetical protein